MTARFSLLPSPFLDDPGRPRVVVTQGEDPYATALAALAAFDLGPARGCRVLIKPNAGRVAPSGSGIVTDCRVVAAACDAFLAAGARVSVGDSPIVGVRRTEALEASGVAAVAQARGCPVLDLDARRYVEVMLPEGVALDRLRVCPEVLEHDLVVSVPVMKTHMHTGVTLAVKNMKGALWRRSKVELHMLPPVPGHTERSLDVAIADMSAVLRPQLSLMDGGVGMEGLGPSAGTARSLGVFVAGADAYAVDAVACRLMGRQAEAIAHLRLGAARGYGVIDLGRIRVAPADFARFAADFAPVPENLAVAFPGVKVLDEASCSACQSTLMLFLRRYGKELVEYFPDRRPIIVAIGKGIEHVHPGTLCIGNCTRMHRANGIFVSGCPPVGSSILRAVTGAPEDPDPDPDPVP
ncbi:MAG: DUF362 domain-containing protein [Polyangiaceae bacterium]|nr:DUF362 domain-containing protein [Polyangiaceae bacterium]